MKRSIWLLAALVLMGTTGYAEEAPMDPAMMEKMKVLMAPGEAHEALKAFEGSWTYAGTFWMTPDAPGQAMTGTTKNEMIFGGRFLKQEIEGPWMGETFQGLGYTGYDNIKKTYQTVWIDSMATGMMTSSGDYNADTRTLSQSGTNSCPLTGETDRKGRSEWSVMDADHNIYTSYAYGPDGKEFKSMEITYTRA